MQMSRLGKSVALVASAVLLVAGFQNCGAKKDSMISNDSSSSGGNNTPVVIGGAGAPTAPNMLVATSISSVEVDLSWSDNSNNETGFRIERSAPISGPFTNGPGSFTLVTTVPTDTHTYKDMNLNPGTTYTYRISAVNGSVGSAYSATAQAQTGTAPTSAPTTPSGLTATAAAATIINLNWTASSGQSYYRVERSANGGTTFTSVATVSANSTSYQDYNLNAASSYTYRVMATNSVGNSNYTANAAATTLAAGNVNTYAYISVNILNTNCVSCHGGGVTSAGVSYASYNATLGTVSKSNSGGSALYTSIANGRMPPGGGMTAAQIAAIKGWIDAGAANN